MAYETISPSSYVVTEDPTDAVIFFGVSLVLGIACRHLLRNTRVPYTVALLILGILLGSLDSVTDHGLGKFGKGIRIWASINPDLLLAVFLPALLFESSFSMEVHQIKRCMAQMLLLAGPGVMISTFCLGTALKLTFPYNWSWKTSLLLGGLLSATDPVAVVALLKELGASKKLKTIIEGESLMNDGTAIVVYQLFYHMVLGGSYNWSAIIKFIVKVSVGAVAIGLAFGIASVFWLGFIFNDTVIEIALTLAVSYTAYFTAQEAANVSGVLTVMTLGMLYATVAKTAFKGEGQQSLHYFWEMVAYIANTMIFILSGVVIAESILGSESIFRNYGNSWAYLVLLYVFVQLSRIIVVGVLYPLLRYFGYGLDWKEAIILTWSGLRGAVALSLSLSVKRSSDDATLITLQTGNLFVFFTGGIVILTLILNGTTTQYILHKLSMDKLSTAKKRILDYTKYEMLNKALEAFTVLGDDEELGPVDWPSVKRYITSLNNFEESSPSQTDSRLGLTNVEDIRIRFLNGVQSAYWGMLEDGRISQTTANILMQSVDEALDRVSDGPLSDWNELKASVQLPRYYNFLQASFIPPKLATYFTVERLEFACYLCAAFLRAHRTARRQLRDFIGDNAICEVVIKESEKGGEEARAFLEDVRVSFPQVLRVVKTRQTAYSVLNHLIQYVQNLEQVGLLEQKEMLHLHDAVQTDLKKLLRNPPLVKIPNIRDLIAIHPLLGALPSWIQGALFSSTKDIMKLRGVPLYKEGSRPTGVWLICNGVVKWTSHTIKNKQSVHPTFTHGSTLGLYELLIGKGYLCDMITDSVVLCCFIEAEKITALLKSDPLVEDFLWQESVTVLAKILLPQVFETMSMQDLRTLVAERSVMTTYLRGESIDVPQHSIGFLLEGFIKANVQGELITSPMTLLPPPGNQIFRGSAIYQNLNYADTQGSRARSVRHHGTSYEVETRARVIFFDIAAFDFDNALRRESSSLLSHSVDHSLRPPSREHGGLMSWPEKYYKSKLQTPNLEISNRATTSLSTRAMHLSIFGSTADLPQCAQSSSRNKTKRSQSLSFLGGNSNPWRSLVSVRSEGATSSAKNSKAKGLAGVARPPETHTSSVSRVTPNAESSDDSGGEDELIVRIDSPSRLSFRQAS